jgi:FkbM family methyltransferase
MRIGNRDIRTVAQALIQPQHYVALRNMLSLCDQPLTRLYQYLFQTGSYPQIVKVKVLRSGSILSLHAFTSHDLLTINEIFCRLDYKAQASAEIIVDLGSNIGISAAYFLSECPKAYVYLFEPLPDNIEKLRLNLQPFQGRYSIEQKAVGLEAGDLQFGWEATGRYGGVGRQTGSYITVNCLDSNVMLENLLEQHGKIDILKIDIETMEKELVQRLPRTVAKKIDRIFVESRFDSNPLQATHDYRQYGSIAQFTAHSCS